MSKNRVFFALSINAVFFACPLLLGLGCGKPSDPQQVEVVQAMAKALMRPKYEGGPKTVCAHLVPEQQNPMGCDNLIVQLLYYAPGFPDSQVTRRGSTQGSFGKESVKVPVHYQGKRGSGDLDVTMQRIEGKWRVYSIFPVGTATRTPASTPASAPAGGPAK